VRVVVAGGTGALGAALVRTLLAGGARVAVPFRGKASFEELRRSLGDPPALFGAGADVADVDGAAAFFEEAVRWLGGLDGVAVVAGAYAGAGPIPRAPVAEWDAMMRANLATTHAVCRAALAHLAPGGSVVTVGARIVDKGGAGAAAYAVSKAAVVALTRALAEENRSRGIRFNCVSPCTLDTPANRAAMPRADFGTWTPVDSVARAIAFLLTADARAITGAVVPVDAAPPTEDDKR
jgi:NAD(P)-dependent dehydrogenase (short-subunit alcohol dehydrogenase family)